MFTRQQFVQTWKDVYEPKLRGVCPRTDLPAEISRLKEHLLAAIDKGETSPAEPPSFRADIDAEHLQTLLREDEIKLGHLLRQWQRVSDQQTSDEIARLRLGLNAMVQSCMATVAVHIAHIHQVPLPVTEPILN